MENYQSGCTPCQALRLRRTAMVNGNHGDPRRRCDDCGQPIPIYPGMGGAGYESQTPHHEHLAGLDSRRAWHAVLRELCRECYLIDHERAYPGVAPGLAPAG